MDEIKSVIESLKAAREAEYAKIRSEISKEKYENKLTMYKLKSSIKHESHIRAEKQAELQTQISSLHTTTPTTDNSK